MSQPTAQRHFYYVVWEARTSTGMLASDGTSEIETTCAVTCYAHVQYLVDTIRHNSPALTSMNVRITNWILLRVEPAPPAQESV